MRYQYKDGLSSIAIRSGFLLFKGFFHRLDNILTLQYKKIKNNPPVQGASGTQFADSLEIVRKHVYAETTTSKATISPGWTPTQWHAFVHLGLHKGSFVF